MKKNDISALRSKLATLDVRANEALGSYDDCAIGIGRFIPGASPWEKHNNGDELLLVTDGEVQIEVLQASGDSWKERLAEGTLFVVPRGHWHQLTAEGNVTILYISPGEEGAERTREHPLRRADE